MHGWWVIVYAVVLAADCGLEIVNQRYQRQQGDRIPGEFQGVLDSNWLLRTQAYTQAKTRWGLFASLCGHLLFLSWLLIGGLGWYDQWISSWGLPFIWQGTLFFLGLNWAQTIFYLPFTFVHTFGIEQRFGFNTSTRRLWLADWCKSLASSTLLLGILLGLVWWLVGAYPRTWWLWVWLAWLAYTLAVHILSPLWLDPWFNTFTPLAEGALADDIRGLANRVGIQVSRIFKMDASRRSRHSNAYFTGLGRVKRIVLYDTLLERLQHEEILAVLAHEMGHWRHHHTLKRIVLLAGVVLGASVLFFWGFQAGIFPGAFALQADSLFAQAVLAGLCAWWITWVFAPGWNAGMRRQETEADDFVRQQLGQTHSLASALIKLTQDNLTPLWPHPLYAAFYFSHPPVVRRIRRLLGAQGNREEGLGQEDDCQGGEKRLK